MSLFITFEGGEGCGKSTQAKALREKLSHIGIPTELTHEPGGTALGDVLRHLLLNKKKQTAISPEAELLLIIASRIQLVSEVIRPKLQESNVVICDRFTDSTIAYQGYGREMDLSVIETINELATQNIKPDLTILLDIPAQKGLRRKQSKKKDRFETEEIAFHNRIRDGYLKLAAKEPKRWLIINATLPRAKIGKIIWDRVKQLLQTENASRCS